MVNRRRVIGYESKLEHDYYLKLEFDHSVKRYEEQPLNVPGFVKGISVMYVPDCLVTFNNGRPQLLVELKYSKELDENEENLQLKIACLNDFASANKIEFKVITEKDVYDTFFDNCLRIYRRAKPPLRIELHRKQILGLLEPAKELTLKKLLQSFGNNSMVWADYTPSIWHMLFTGEIVTDLNEKITYESILRVAHG